ncbi:MAG TPA: hypothetical protein VD862_03120 [Candidatus Paceibacterota bacterium]|nr:hypothetical protein [Candidatus Paceibacterota bacterium]
MRRSVLALLFFCLAAFPSQARAQMFGKNVVQWEKADWQYYQSAHFDYYLALDLEEADIREHLADLVGHLEGSYEFLSVQLQHELKKRPIVIVARTHSGFESLHVAGADPFMPEGVGAYALPRGSRLLPNTDLILAVKPDFLPVLNRTIYTHELTHIFQFDMIGWHFFGLAGGGTPERWLFEATADYLANMYAPYSRDDIRRMQQRVAAANTKNPMTGLPTLQMLSYGMANPYSMGAMIFEFLEARYGREAVMRTVAQLFKDHGNRNTVEILSDLSQGEFSTAEAFDRAHRDYWAAQAAKDSLDRPKPYQETGSFRGRQVIKRPFPYPLTSVRTSPDGSAVAFLTFDRKYGIVLAVAPALPQQDPTYIPYRERRKSWTDRFRVPPPVKVLTTYMPPKPYEYIVGQQLNVWPFNGFDIDWWQEPSWAEKMKEVHGERERLNEAFAAAKNRRAGASEAGDASAEEKAGLAAAHQAELDAIQAKLDMNTKAIDALREAENVNLIAFFARHNRDHALFLLDVNLKKITRRTDLPLDQAFSPAFSPDGRTVFFSAARNIRRDIYAVNLADAEPEPRRITAGGVFNSAPAVSPDGSTLAYVAFVGGYQKLFRMDLATGTTEQLTYGRWNDNSPSWSANGKLLAFTSDEKDRIWNLYTLETATKTVRQWTEFYGGVFAPNFVSAETDRLVASVYLEEDQYQSFIYPNFELFDITTKEPLTTRVVGASDENMELAFRSAAVITEELDRRQLEHPTEPPARWKLYGSDVYLGASTYWGMFGYSRIAVQNLLGDKTHQGMFAQGGFYRYLNYTYVDQSRRWNWGTGVSYTRYPLYYQFYSIEGKRPRYPAPNDKDPQFVLNSSWLSETSATVFTQYPFNKWDRVEFGIRPRRQSFLLPFELDNIPEEDLAFIPPSDLQMYDFLKSSSGRTNIGLMTAFVHDTVLYSPSTYGPQHGTAFRAQAEFGPGLDGSPSYMTGYVDARRYLRLTESSLFAVRAAGLYSTRENGDFMLLGGSDTLRTYPYFSVAGNRVGYGSAELRFPFADVALFGAIPFQVRGIMFGDYAVTQFSNDRFPARHEWAYGFGLQAWLFLPMNFEWARTKFDPDTWRFNFRIGVNF